MATQPINGIGFWSHTNGNFRCFSNFYRSNFEYHGKRFCCSEQAFMWMKAVTFGDDTIANQILLESDPKIIKSLGRKVKSYKEDVWNKVRYNVMLEVNLAKYEQNEDIKQILLSTNNSYLYENSPYDSIWGVGKDHMGQNLLGKVLMEVRQKLQSKAREEHE